MKKMKRRISAIMLTMMMVVGMLVAFAPVTETKATETEVTKLTIHYSRDNGDYDGWGIWLWPTKPQTNPGGEIAFTADDDFGKVATYDVSAGTTEVGFILKKGDWEDKDIETDRAIVLDSPNVEVWLKQGDEKVYTSNPGGANVGGSNDTPNAPEVEPGTTTVVFHYNRPNNDYDGWNLWTWPEGVEGKRTDFVTEDSYGKIAIIKFDVESSKVGFIIRMNEWEAKDIEQDRFIDVTNGYAEVWLQCGYLDIAYEPKDGAPRFDLNNYDPNAGTTKPSEDTTTAEPEKQTTTASQGEKETTAATSSDDSEEGGSNLVLIIVIIVVVVAGAGGAFFFIKSKGSSNNRTSSAPTTSNITTANPKSVAPKAAAPQASAPLEFGKIYDVKLTDAGSDPEHIANVIYEVTNISIAEAMDMVYNTPKVIVVGATKPEAEKIKSRLEAAGATIVLE